MQLPENLDQVPIERVAALRGPNSRSPIPSGIADAQIPTILALQLVDDSFLCTTARGGSIWIIDEVSAAVVSERVKDLSCRDRGKVGLNP